MKLTKVLLIAAAPVLALGVTGAVLAFNPDEKPKETVQRQSAPVTQTEDDTDNVAADDTPAPTETEPVVDDVPTEPTLSLKDEVAQKIRQKAIENGVSNVDRQVSCADMLIMKEGGYTQEVVDAMYKVYLYLATPEHPNAYVYFDGSCRMFYENTGSA